MMLKVYLIQSIKELLIQQFVCKFTSHKSSIVNHCYINS